MSSDIQPTEQPTQFPYVYFISYAHVGGDGGSFGFGNTEIRTAFPITTTEQIEQMTQAINEGYRSSGQSVAILGYQLLRNDGAAGESL